MLPTVRSGRHCFRHRRRHPVGISVTLSGESSDPPGDDVTGIIITAGQGAVAAYGTGSIGGGRSMGSPS